jgi:hypothetical protein
MMKMGVKVQFEIMENNRPKTMEFADSSVPSLTEIVVGTRDIVLIGTMKECVKWFQDVDKIMRAGDGQGDDVWIILRGIAAKPSEEIAKAYGNAFGIGGIGSLCFTGVSAFTSSINTSFQAGENGEGAGLVLGALANVSGINVDNAIGSVIDKVMGKKVAVRISCARGIYQKTADGKDTVIKLPSGSNSKWGALALASLKG